MKVSPMIVAFDCDGTLLHLNEKPNDDMIAMVKAMAKLKAHIIIWSGGGQDWAERIAYKLGLTEYADEIIAKDPKVQVDIAFDDEPDFKLADKVFIVRD